MLHCLWERHEPESWSSPDDRITIRWIGDHELWGWFVGDDSTPSIVFPPPLLSRVMTRPPSDAERWLMMRVPAGELGLGRPLVATSADHLSPKEFAAHVGVRMESVQTWLDRGEVPGAGRMIRTRVAAGETLVINLDQWIAAAPTRLS